MTKEYRKGMVTMKKRPMAKLPAWLLVSALALPLLPVSLPEALAADHTYYIDYGNITVSQNAGDASMLDVTYYASSGAPSTTKDTVAAADDIVITQTSGTGSTISVISGEANITLEGVHIYNTNSCPFTISSGAAVHLTLSGENRLDTGGSSTQIAGMLVPTGAVMVIDKKNSDTSDSLYTQGGSYCAGIGGGNGQSCGTVTINGGSITAIGTGGAGIGGGSTGTGGTVTIHGGIISAGSVGGAGIGGGANGAGGTTIITGGSVTAHGGMDSAGIGGGKGCSGGTITITGGKILASGYVYTTYPYEQAPNIGGGLHAGNQGTLSIDIPVPDVITQADYGGQITENGGGSYTVEATQEDYVIDGLWVDGTLVPTATGTGSQSVYGAKESIMATFAYTANFNKPANGSLTVSSAGETITSGEIVRGGQQLVITAGPDAGYVLESLTVNGEDVTDEYASGYTYTVGTKGYYRNLTAQKDTGTQGARIAASFVLESSLDDILISITPPDAIAGIAYGTEKTAAALGLPATVTLVTDHGTALANVTWDVASCAYDPGNIATQTFTVLGAVTLPAGVQNPNSVALSTGVSVSVNAAQPVPAAWLTAAADGAADVLTSTKIDLTFDTAIVGLKAEDITLADGTGSVIKGALLGSGTNWSIALDSVLAQGDVSVAVASPAGYSISGSPKNVAIYKAAQSVPAALLTAAADGAADTVTSTKIDLTFDTAIAGLKAEDITLTDGTGSAIKGALLGSGTYWSIALDSVLAQGNVSVAMASPSGYSITGSPKTVAIYKAAEPSGTPPLITTNTLENGRAGLPYSQALLATGDTPVIWTVETGSLAGGLTLSYGIISGTPLEAGIFAFTVKAQNNAGFDTKALSITVDPSSYTIATSADLGGSITPGGTVTVAAGSSQTFTIKPDTGFAVASVTVDGIGQGPINEYTFAAVDKNHSIHASFISLGDGMAYSLRETEVSSTLITAQGLFTPSAKLNAIPLGGGDASREELAARLSGKDVIAAFEITIDPMDAFRPPLNVSFEIGEMYNGRTVYILHRLHSGDVEQFTPTVMDGEASITVNELSPFLLAADPWITITAQPQDATVMAGQTALFSISVEGGAALTYHWQKRTEPNAAWSDISGAVGPEYTTSQTTLANNGFGYRVIVTDAMGNSVTTDAATLTVVKPPETGDHAQPVLYTSLMILFLAFAVILVRRRKTA